MPRQCDCGENTARAPCSLPGEFQWDTIRIQRSGQTSTQAWGSHCPAPAAMLPALPQPAEGQAESGPRNPGSAALAPPVIPAMLPRGLAGLLGFRSLSC